MDNTVGSLNQFQKSVIIGSILGDGYIQILPNKKDVFLEINHSIKAKEYVDWKYSVLRNICSSPPHQKENDRWKVAYRFFTRQHPELTKLLNEFYQNKRKTIPANLKLNPIILAVWFMDDGSRTKKGDIYLNSQQFSFQEQERLLYFLRRIGLKARLNKDKKYYRIKLLKESIPKFYQLVKAYIVPSMRYKLSESEID